MKHLNLDPIIGIGVMDAIQKSVNSIMPSLEIIESVNKALLAPTMAVNSIGGMASNFIGLHSHLSHIQNPIVDDILKHIDIATTPYLGILHNLEEIQKSFALSQEITNAVFGNNTQSAINILTGVLRPSVERNIESVKEELTEVVEGKINFLTATIEEQLSWFEELIYTVKDVAQTAEGEFYLYLQKRITLAEWYIQRLKHKLSLLLPSEEGAKIIKSGINFIVCEAVIIIWLNPLLTAMYLNPNNGSTPVQFNSEQIVKNPVTVYSDANISSKNITDLPKGTIVKIIRINDNWAYILATEINDTPVHGWIKCEEISQVDPEIFEK